MQQNKVLVGVGIAVLAIAGGWFGGSFNKPTDTVTREVVKELQPIIEQAFGANAGPEDLNPFHCQSGVCEYSYSEKVKTATSTVCAFKSPGASTTIQVLPRVQFSTALGYSSGWLWGYASTQNSTSTALGALSTLTSPAKGATVVASSTNDVIPPNTHFSLNLSTSTAGVNANFAPAGFCEMSLISLSGI